MKDISSTLKSYFKSKKITQTEMADTLGVSQGYIALMLNGGQPFGRMAAEKWEKAFGVCASWLMTGEGEMLVENRDKNVNTQTISIGDGIVNNSNGAKVTVDKTPDDMIQIIKECQRQSSEVLRQTAQMQEILRLMIEKIK